MLHLEGNQIRDISPLVENSGLGEGDEVWLWNNNLALWEGSEDLENIRTLKKRGVIVHHDPIGPPPVGDINGDGKVDISDLAAIASAFNTKQGDEGWNPEADLNADGMVDIYDLALVGLDYGKA